MAPLAGVEHVVLHKLRILHAFSHNLSVPAGMHRNCFAAQIMTHVRDNPVIEIGGLHVIHAFKGLRGRHEDKGIQLLAGPPDHADKIFLELGFVNAAEGVIKPKMDDERVRPERCNVIIKSPHTVKGIFSMAGAIDQGDAPGCAPVSENIRVAALYAVSCGYAAAPDEYGLHGSIGFAIKLDASTIGERCCAVKVFSEPGVRESSFVDCGS